MLIEHARKNKKVDEIRVSLPPACDCQLPEMFLPARFLEIDRARDIGVPAAPDHEELPVLAVHKGERFHKIRSQYDVAVEVAEKFVPRHALRGVEEGPQNLGALGCAFDLRDMADAKLARSFRRTFLIAKENHLDVRMKECPALQRVALNHSVMSRKWLRRRK